MWIGKGLSSFFTYGPIIQFSTFNILSKKVAYVWAHNELIEILFELGLIGASLTVSFYISALLRSRYKQGIFTSLVVFGATSFTQMPLRQAVSSVYIAFLIRLAFAKAEEYDNGNG